MICRARGGAWGGGGEKNRKHEQQEKRLPLAEENDYKTERAITGQRNKRGNRKRESNDSPEIPDRKEH